MTTPPVAIKTVLVADATAFVCDRFRKALEEAGHRTITAATGNELLARLSEYPGVDLIVLDLRLPSGHGVRLLRAVQKIAPRPPLLVFSGTIANAAEVRELAALGVAGYINEYTTAHHIMPSLAPHLFPEHHTRRSGPRVLLGIPVAYRFGNTVAAALSLNISQGGVSVRTTNPLELGTTVTVRFRLPSGREIEAAARVASVDRRGGMGLRFTSITPADRSAVGEFVQTHFFSNRKA